MNATTLLGSRKPRFYVSIFCACEGIAGVKGVACEHIIRKATRPSPWRGRCGTVGRATRRPPRLREQSVASCHCAWPVVSAAAASDRRGPQPRSMIGALRGPTPSPAARVRMGCARRVGAEFCHLRSGVNAAQRDDHARATGTEAHAARDMPPTPAAVPLHVAPRAIPQLDVAQSRAPSRRTCTDSTIIARVRSRRHLVTRSSRWRRGMGNAWQGPRRLLRFRRRGPP